MSDIAIARLIIKQEVVRKAIHISGIVTVILANINYELTFIALSGVTLLYIVSEAMRLKNIPVPLIHYVTKLAGRGDMTNQIAAGPITLSMGILLTLAIFPYQIASLAIVALTLGDGFASLIGRPFGVRRPRFLLGKSLEGSLACFLVVLIASFLLASYYGLSFLPALPLALVIALTTTVVEVMPLKSFDNLAIPLAVGGITFLFLTLI
ncbi:MAG: phosphatidate cytidylyltransferase [Spirochaetaceae bacterium]|nr:phosphatidate cytidylyltransferase [Spirochaetaceae bacterium]